MENLKEQLKNKVISIGTDITIVDSLVNFLEMGIEDKFDLNNYDLANLALVIQKMMKIIKSKQDKIEQILEI